MGAKVFVPWKNCDVFFEVECECGNYGIAAGHCAYLIECDECGAIWEMPTNIEIQAATTGGHAVRMEPAIVEGSK